MGFVQFPAAVPNVCLGNWKFSTFSLKNVDT